MYNFRNSILAVSLAAVLFGCGGSSDGKNDNINNEDPSNQPTKKETFVKGKAIDGYLRYATVCLDLMTMDIVSQQNHIVLLMKTEDLYLKLQILKKSQIHNGKTEV